MADTEQCKYGHDNCADRQGGTCQEDRGLDLCAREDCPNLGTFETCSGEYLCESHYVSC